MRAVNGTKAGGWGALLRVAAAGALVVLGACDSPGSGGTGGLYIPTDATTDGGSEPDGGSTPDAVTPDGSAPDTTVPDTPSVDTTAPDAGPGDTHTPPPDGGPVEDTLADVGPTTTTIPALQAAAEAAGCDAGGILNGAQVALSGVVVTSPKFDAYTPSDPTKTALDGYFVADPAGGAWSGLVVVVDRALGTSFAPGDLVDIVGEHQEFYCLTQVEASQMSLSGTGTVPAPASLTASAVASEENEGRLVRVEGVKVLDEVAAGVYSVEGGFQVGHKFDFFLQLDVGATYDLVGEVGYSYGQFQLYPRSEGDITQVGGPAPDTSGGDTSGDTSGGDVGPAPTSMTILEINQSPESVNCSSASVQDIGGLVTVEGTILLGPIDLASTLFGYLLTDGTMEPWGGLMVTWPKTTPGTFSPGDTVRFTGTHVEYYCQTEFAAQDGTVIGSGSGFEVPVVSNDEDWEQWEGSLVILMGVTVVGDSDWSAYGDLDLENGLVLDDWIAGPGVILHPGVGTTLEQVAGVIHYAFGTYRIAPISNDDLVY